MMKNGVKLVDLNEYIKCKLCKGYLIDATTIVECLHSFCKTCIVKYLDGNKTCPTCDTQIHKTKPLLNIRSDPSLQDIVYKIVPGLFKGEMKRRNEFYAKHPEAAINLTSSEDRGIISGERVIYSPDDKISLSVEYLPEVISYSYLPLSSSSQSLSSSKTLNNKSENQRRYLLCEGGMKVLHLKKWLRSKYELKANHELELLYKHDQLSDEYTMMDLAYIYSWRRNGPLSLYYKITDTSKPIKRRKMDLKRSEIKKELKTNDAKPKTKIKFANDVPSKITHSDNRRLAKVIEKLTRGVALNEKMNANKPNSVSLKLTKDETLISFKAKLETCTKESFPLIQKTSDWSALPLPSETSKSLENLNSEAPVNGVTTQFFQAL